MIVSESLTKNEWMSELLIFLRESLIRSFLGKKQVIRSENQWANSQPWIFLSITFDIETKISIYADKVVVKNEQTIVNQIRNVIIA